MDPGCTCVRIATVAVARRAGSPPAPATAPHARRAAAAGAPTPLVAPRRSDAAAPCRTPARPTRRSPPAAIADERRSRRHRRRRSRLRRRAARPRPRTTSPRSTATTHYNPVADPTLPRRRQMPVTYDPWEKLNRRSTASTTRSTAPSPSRWPQAYVQGGAAPGAPGRQQLLQQPRPAGQRAQRAAAGQAEAGGAVARPLPAELTLGIGGIFDPASDAKLPRKQRGFRPDPRASGAGSARATSSCRCSARAPCAMRSAWSATRRCRRSAQVEDDKTRVFLQGLQLVDVRTQLLPSTACAKARSTNTRWSAIPGCSAATTRSATTSKKADDQTCPSTCWKRTDNPTVPADAMPVIPGSATP